MVKRTSSSPGGDHETDRKDVDMNAEILHLRESISAMRDELEKANHDKLAAVQKARARAQDELDQLKATVQALRDQMEQQAVDRRAAVQAAVADGNEESSQLKETVQALRDEMEAMKFAHADAVQSIKSEYEGQIAQMKDTIFAMREEMEQAGPEKNLPAKPPPGKLAKRDRGGKTWPRSRPH